MGWSSWDEIPILALWVGYGRYIGIVMIHMALDGDEEPIGIDLNIIQENDRLQARKRSLTLPT